MNYDSINRLWQKSLILLIPLISIILGIVYYFNQNEDIIVYLYWIHLPILMIHEFEEYVFPGGFKEFFNKKTVFALDPVENDVPLNEPMIFWINIGVWIFIILGALLVNIVPWLGLIFILFNGLFNGFGHLFLFQIKVRGYNPGLVTTILFVVPLSVLVVLTIHNQTLFSVSDWIISIAGGIVIGALLPISAKIRIKKFIANQEG
jgi:hypothetical protein